jgi:endonuclease/exonuclease/phosphatase family metal-dependent hydrolase
MTDPGQRAPGATDRATVIITVAIVAILCLVGAAVVVLHGSGRPASMPLIPSGSTSPTSIVEGPSVTPSGLLGTASPSPSPASSSASATKPSKAAPSCVAKTATRPLRVVTFNIHSALHGRTVEIDQIAAELAALKPDVVLLQEVDANRGYSGWVDMPAVLSSTLHMTYAFGVNVLGQTTSHGPSEYGTLVLARYPILSKTNTPLVNEHGLQQRGLLHVVLDVDGTRLSVYNTHLENNPRGGGSEVDLRTRQAEQAAGIIAGDPNPVILGGDFNSGPGSAAMNALERVVSDPWRSVGIGSPDSHEAPRPTIRIDYLLNRGAGLTPVQAQVGTTSVSDHEPVITDYRLAVTELVGDCVHRS